MRPRLLHLGYTCVRRRLGRRGDRASMRPRLLHLGYLADHFTEGDCNESFNEAEAFTPRIRLEVVGQGIHVLVASMRPRLLHLGYQRYTVLMGIFGGASMRPRLLHLGYALDVVVLLIHRHAASMRPRLLHLGYVAELPGPMLLRHSFNEAEAFTPRIPRLRGADRPLRGASMRPRLLHLGYHRTYEMCLAAVQGLQ